ncbi:recombinase family protein [Butyrivibrio sp. FC2001]|uniref:recombinase family protein n=1 Tax=Butyrivibrio sp. FC2001 TaxID=1280671 RepID=UPI0004245CEB|nr:recombinase family protein [Butyrivibrio sp. FC2001]
MGIQVIKSKKSNEKLRVAAYCRVSSDTDEQESSLENQIDYYTKLIKNNPLYEFAGIYTDQGISGYVERRPGFKQMMEDARQGKIDLIITKSITRFARNTDTVLKASRELKKLGIGIFFELQNMNTLKEDGEFLLTVYAAFAQGERDTYKELADMTYRRRFEECKPFYNIKNVLGFDMDGKQNIIVNKEEAKNVKQIFTWVKQNYSTVEIVKKCKEAGITNTMGKPVTRVFIIKTIRNVQYKGDYIMQSTYTDDKKISRRNNGVVPSYYIKNNHPAIVSRKLWEDAKRCVDERSSELHKRLVVKPMTTTNYPYKNMIYCAECGGKMKAVKKKSGLEYSYTCQNRRKYGSDFCNNRAVPQKVIESWGTIDEPVYVSFDKEKPIDKQYKFVRGSTWRKGHIEKVPPEDYTREKCFYYRRIFCDKCGSMLRKTTDTGGNVHFRCGGHVDFGNEYCKGIYVPKEKLDNLPQVDGYYLIKEEKKGEEKRYSYTCKEERPIRKERPDRK